MVQGFGSRQKKEDLAVKVALTGATGFIAPHVPTHPSLVEEFRQGSYRKW
jgi:hypothetical protein